MGRYLLTLVLAIGANLNLGFANSNQNIMLNCLASHHFPSMAVERIREFEKVLTAPSHRSQSKTVWEIKDIATVELELVNQGGEELTLLRFKIQQPIIERFDQYDSADRVSTLVTKVIDSSTGRLVSQTTSKSRGTRKTDTGRVLVDSNSGAYIGPDIRHQSFSNHHTQRTPKRMNPRSIHHTREVDESDFKSFKIENLPEEVMVEKSIGQQSRRSLHTRKLECSISLI
jgi:hypothetical protein